MRWLALVAVLMVGGCATEVALDDFLVWGYCVEAR